MNTELMKRMVECQKDIRAGVYGDWKIEQAIKDKLCKVKWNRTEEVAWKSSLTKTDNYKYEGQLISDGTILEFEFIAQRNKCKNEAYRRAFNALERYVRETENIP